MKVLGLPMLPALVAGPLLAALGAAVIGWFAVRLSGVYAAMLTLAFAQILWSIAFQWVPVTGGDNGLLGVWPSPWAASAAHFYWLTLALVVLAVGALRMIIFSPFGYALRAARDSDLRSEAIGIDRQTRAMARLRDRRGGRGARGRAVRVPQRAASFRIRWASQPRSTGW